jgi:pimeloyl-ACP methyl ester carboxylesterase
VKRRLRIWLTVILAAIVTGYAGLSWVGAGWLISPPRKTLRDWQVAQLERREPCGMRIERFIADGGTPCLMCVPDPVAGPAIRGALLRQQMAVAGLDLSPYGRLRGTLVLLHGWGMRKEDLLITAQRFCAAGFRCVIPDLPGHGENRSPFTGFGTSSYERELPRTVLESAARRFHFSPRPAALWGMSMGGAYAVEAAAATPASWSALVVVSSFDALEPVVSGELRRGVGYVAGALHPGLMLAIRCRAGFWLGQVRPIDSAPHLRLPTLILHGSNDVLIPMREGRQLFEAVPDVRKQWLEVESATHRNVLGTPQLVFADMSAWCLNWMAASQ